MTVNSQPLCFVAVEGLHVQMTQLPCIMAGRQHHPNGNIDNVPYSFPEVRRSDERMLADERLPPPAPQSLQTPCSTRKSALY